MSSGSKWINLQLPTKIKPCTDIGDLAMQMETRTCKCSCKRTFRVLKSSQQQYASDLCRWAFREFKPPKKHTWQKMDAVVFAESKAKRGRPKKVI